MTTPEPRSTRFQLNEADLVAAQRSHIRTQFFRRDKPWIGGIAIAVVVLLLLLAGWLALAGEPSSLIRIVAGLVAFTLLAVAVDRWVAPLSVKRQFRAVAAFSREMEFSWDADGFQLSSERESANLPWAEITAARKTNDAVLLYRSPRMHHIIPLRALTEGEPDAIIAAAVASS